MSLDPATRSTVVNLAKVFALIFGVMAGWWIGHLLGWW
jgi:hypothetical protein